MADIWAENGGIHVGYACDPTDSRPPQLTKENELRYVGDRHAVLIGPNGSGKSRRLLLVALAELLGWSILCCDVKAELAWMSAEWRRKHGSQVYILNPYEAYELSDDGHNPVASLKLNDDFPDDALEQAEAIIKIEGNQPHFSQAAQELIAGLLMYVRLVLNGSYEDVRALLALDEQQMRRLVVSGNNLNRSTFEAWKRADADERKAKFDGYNPPFEYKGKLYPGAVIAGMNFDWEEIGIKLGRYGDIRPDNREMLSVISTALTQTRWLDSRPIKRSLVKPPIDFSVMKEKPTTVYLCLPPRRLGTHATWLRLMISAVVSSLMKDTRRAKVPVLLMLDEYYAIAQGGFPVIEKNMAMFRGYGIKLWTVWQDLAQARLLYGDTGFETFMANAGVLQSFAAQDLVTAEYISRRTGQTTRVVTSGGRSRNPNPGAPMGVSMSDSMNKSQVPMPLLLPQDVRDLDDGMTILFSHKAKGTVCSYLPWPGRLPHMKEIMARDSSA